MIEGERPGDRDDVVLLLSRFHECKGTMTKINNVNEGMVTTMVLEEEKRIPKGLMSPMKKT